MKAGVVATTPGPLARALRPAICAGLLLCMALLAGCTSVPPAQQTFRDDNNSSPVIVYIARRKWHVDVGFAARDLVPALGPLKTQFTTAKYVFFGFGDRRYLLARNRSMPSLLGALWPGAALILVTAIEDSPAQAFGASQVLSVHLNPAQARAMQAYVRASLSAPDLKTLAPGPYADSAYFEASAQYSALHTCNTWAAEALQAGDQPVHSKGVVFAGQLWRQASRLVQPAAAAAAIP